MMESLDGPSWLPLPDELVENPWNWNEIFKVKKYELNYSDLVTESFDLVTESFEQVTKIFFLVTEICEISQSSF
jgi:hypothetical protein